ncbi:MAG: hypothetical protein ACE5G8_07790, partial [Anaerolineae bacterium]
GIKVWVYKGDMLPNGEMPVDTVAPEERRPRRPRGDRPENRRPGGRGRGPRQRRAAVGATAGSGCVRRRPGSPGRPGDTLRLPWGDAVRFRRINLPRGSLF